MPRLIARVVPAGTRGQSREIIARRLSTSIRPHLAAWSSPRQHKLMLACRSALAMTLRPNAQNALSIREHTRFIISEGLGDGNMHDGKYASHESWPRNFARRLLHRRVSSYKI